jgi:hypothetical protein
VLAAALAAVVVGGVVGVLLGIVLVVVDVTLVDRMLERPHVSILGRIRREAVGYREVRLAQEPDLSVVLGDESELDYAQIEKLEGEGCSQVGFD